ncbi:DUF1295 domain-containing protein [Pseudomonadota bacterium]
MFDWQFYSLTLLICALVGLVGWLESLKTNLVSGVDSLWSLMFLLISLACFINIGMTTGRPLLVLVLVSIWALRLSFYIAIRSKGEGEDHRYEAIRQNNQPGFRIKSLYIVFGFQALLAWLIALPLAVAIDGSSSLGLLDAFAVVLWLTGMFFEVVGDEQLKRFKADPANQGRVLDTGLWKFTRHPNYFGECLIWWGYFLLAAAAGGWWTILSPMLMTFLLLKVSGVTLLEKDISTRRPAYASYIKRTNAFLPGPGRVQL